MIKRYLFPIISSRESGGPPAIISMPLFVAVGEYSIHPPSSGGVTSQALAGDDLTSIMQRALLEAAKDCPVVYAPHAGHHAMSNCSLYGQGSFGRGVPPYEQIPSQWTKSPMDSLRNGAVTAARLSTHPSTFFYRVRDEYVDSLEYGAVESSAAVAANHYSPRTLWQEEPTWRYNRIEIASDALHKSSSTCLSHESCRGLSTYNSYINELLHN